MADTKKYYHNIDADGNVLSNLRLNPKTTAERLALVLGSSDQGYVVYDTDLNIQFFWDGTAWVSAVSAGDKFNILAAGTQTAGTAATVVLSNSNNVSFGMSNNSVITASMSYTQPTDYISTGQSSLFQQTSGMSDYQQTSLMSNYLGTTYTSHTHSQYINTSVSSAFQQTSGMSDYQATSLMSNYLNTSVSSQFQQTSATSAITSNALNTSQSSLFQQTSLMSNYLGTTYTSHTHSQYINTSVSSNFQQTSLMSNYLGTTASLNDLADVVISSATVNQVLKYNGANWINADTGGGVGAGNGVILYFDETLSGIAGYETIAPTPDSDPEVDEFVTVNNSTALLHGYANPVPIGRTTIDAGAWDFNIYTYVSNTTPTSTLVFEAYSRTSGGVETLLFSAESDPINFTSVDLMNFTSVQPAFTVNATDYLVIKVYGKTTALVNIDVHFVHSGTVHYSHVHTPLAPLHNDLGGLQGGASNEYFHLNSGDYANRNISATSVYQLTANMSNYQATSLMSNYQQTSLMSNYLGTTYTSHTHSQYINTSQSSLFQQTSQMSDYQQTSLMSNYLGTTYTSHTHSQYINTSVSSDFQQVSATSAITSNALNTSQSSLFQQTSLMSNYQQTSLMSNYLGTAATQSFRFTSADSQLQFTSAMSNYLGTAATQSFRFTSADTQLQFTSAMSNYLGTTYTSHTHSQYINTSVSSNFLTSQTVQPVAASGSNGSFAFSTLSFGNLNGLSFYTSNGSIVGSYTAGGAGGGSITVSAGASSAQLNSLVFSNSNGVSFGLNGSTITGSVETAYAASTHSHGNPTLFLTNLSGTTASASNGLTLSLSAAAPGAAGTYLALTYNNRQLGASTNSNPGQNSVWLVPMYVGQSVYASTGLHMVSLTGSVTSNQTNTVAYTWEAALYKVTGTNSSRFDTVYTTSLGFTFWNSGTASVSYSYNATSGSSAGSNLMTASVYGLRQLTFNIGSTLSPGDYAWGFRQSSASSGNSSILRSFNAVMDNPLPIAMGFLGSATNNSIGYVEAGTYSVTSASMPASFNVSQVIQTLNVVPYFKMGAV